MQRRRSRFFFRTTTIGHENGDCDYLITPVCRRSCWCFRTALMSCGWVGLGQCLNGAGSCNLMLCMSYFISFSKIKIMMRVNFWYFIELVCNPFFPFSRDRRIPQVWLKASGSYNRCKKKERYRIWGTNTKWCSEMDCMPPALTRFWGWLESCAVCGVRWEWHSLWHKVSQQVE